MARFIVDKKEILEKFVADKMSEKLKGDKEAKFILATGNSPIGVYKELISRNEQGLITFEKLTSFNLDEYRNIEKFHDDSFKKFMKDNLFDHVNIDQSKTFFPNDIDEYNLMLDKIDKFDFTILGVGTNGHIAFNEPGTKFETRTNEVDLTKSTIESNFGDRNEHPIKAITMGLYDIYNKSSEIILLAWGENKKDALIKFNEGIKRDDYPITHFIDHPNIIIVTDLEDFKK